MFVGAHEAIYTCRLVKHLFECQATIFGVVTPQVNTHLGTHQWAGFTNPVCESRRRQQCKTKRC